MRAGSKSTSLWPTELFPVMAHCPSRCWVRTASRTADSQRARALNVGESASQVKAFTIITTSSFRADARIYAERVNARIVLIDGPELAQLMVEHSCGVRVEETFVLKEVDEDFFDES
jgi:restriction endonuclease Mrr